jgi:hypothetical protein
MESTMPKVNWPLVAVEAALFAALIFVVVLIAIALGAGDAP